MSPEILPGPVQLLNLGSRWARHIYPVGNNVSDPTILVQPQCGRQTAENDAFHSGFYVFTKKQNVPFSPGFTDYVLDEHGALRRHVQLSIDDVVVLDRKTLKDRVPDHGTLYIFQSLSGG